MDVKDISPDAIRQVVPADKSQGFSNEYLPFIEFFEEDFPWRYTPKRSTDKLCSWLLLLACTDDEFTLTTDAQGNKRVELHLEGLSEWYLNDFYPDPDWYHRDAHVQITTPGDEDPVEYVKDHPDDGFSRLFCCRLLKENTKYTVFLVPAFELGRLAGLGEPVSGSVGLTTLSFEGKPASIVYPVYYHWSFTTGKASFMTYAQKQDFISDTEFRALSPGLKADISDTGLRQYRTLEPLVNDAEPVDIPVALVKKGFAEKDLSSEDPRMDGELKDLLKKSPVFSDDADKSYADVIALVGALYKSIPESAKDYIADLLPSLPDNDFMKELAGFFKQMDFKGDLDKTFAILTVLSMKTDKDEKDKEGEKPGGNPPAKPKPKPAAEEDDGKPKFKASALLQLVVFAGEVPCARADSSPWSSESGRSWSGG